MTSALAPSPLYAGAVLSPDNLHRYLLTREVRLPAPGEQLRSALFVMLNPSTADASVNDATTRKIIAMVKLWKGYGRFEIVNLFSYRATDPKALLGNPHVNDLRSDGYLVAAAARADLIVCGWGANATGIHPGRARVVTRLLLKNARRPGDGLFCLGQNKDASPVHPLFQKAAAPLLPFTWGQEGMGGSPASLRLAMAGE
jgi:hypothetical protein